MKKALRNHSKILRKYFLYKHSTNAERITSNMSTLFTSSGMRKAVWTLKNNKTPRMDQINVELINYSPEVVYEKIYI